MNEIDKREDLNKKSRESYYRNKHKRLVRSRLYYQQNKDILNKQEKERRGNNSEAYKKRRKEYYVENREMLLSRSQVWL